MLKFEELTAGKLYRYCRSGEGLKVNFYAYNQIDFKSLIDLFSGATSHSKINRNDLIVLLAAKDNISMTGTYLKDSKWLYVMYNDMIGWLMFRHGDWELVT